LRPAISLLTRRAGQHGRDNEGEAQTVEEVKLTMQFTGEENVLVEFPAENLTVSVPYSQVGECLYRLDGVPVGVESAGYRDIIEADVVNGVLRFQRVAERSGWKTYDYIVSPSRIESELGQSLLRELEARGGHWERVFGGLLFICVPPGLEFDPTPWVNEA
jgi:hypothetical protein